MKWLLISLLALVSCTPGPKNNQSLLPEGSETDRVSFADGRVSFAPPTDFRPLTQEQIERKFPRGNAPKHVFANETQSVSVGVTFSPANVSPDQLQKLKETMEQTLPRMVSGIQWQTRDFVEI